MTTYYPFYPQYRGLRERPTVKLYTPIKAGEAARLMGEIAAAYGVTVEQICGPSRKRAVAWPRQELMWVLYKTGRYSMPQIARFIGGRDHTTVLHGIRKHEERMVSVSTENRLGVDTATANNNTIAGKMTA